MKKIRTREQLNDFLDKDISWRKRELSAYRLLLKKNKSGVIQFCLCRGGTALLYAHWEGFIKSAAESYLRFIASQGLSYDELSNNLLAIAIKTKLNDATSSKRIKHYSDLIKFLRTELSTRSKIPWDNTIKTQSNLSSAVLEEIIESLGFDFSLYETKRKFIDEKLVSRRNNIAHGEFLDIDEKEYEILHNEVVSLMDTFRNQIDNSAAMKSFRSSLAKSTSSSTPKVC